MKINYKKILPHIVALIIFIAISAIYFLPQFQGKTLYQGDIINHRAMAKESVDFYNKTGEVTLWTNSMFGGMPTYQINAPQKHNYLKQVRNVLELGFSRPAGYFIMGMVSIYILFLILGFSFWLGIIGAITFSFLTYPIIFYEAGHMTKITAIMLSPLVLSGAILILHKKYLFGGIIFSIAMGLELLSNHYQMTYYLGIAIAILVVIEFIPLVKNKEYKSMGIMLGIFAIGVFLAIGSSASKIWTTYEYAKDTMRGNPILKTEGKPTSSSQTKGLEWNYAMNWSHGVLDLASTFIPGVVGGSSSEKVSNKSAFAKKLRILTKKKQKTYNAPLYWGSLPFTSGPPYLGALLFFLFILGLFVIKNKYKWWALITVILFFLLSMGKNFEFFNKLFYDYFPMYNKFRSPNSIMSIVALPFVFFAIYTIRYILQGDYDKKEFIKKLWITLGITGGISLFFAILGPAIFDFASPGDARYEKSGLVPSILQTRKALMRADAFRTLVIVALGAGLIWAFIKKKITEVILIAGIGIISIFDILTVDLRYVSQNDFVKKKKIENQFQPRDVDKELFKDDDPYYRIIDFTVDPFNNAQPSYFHKNVGGYHAAKLQRYQDMIDKYISKGNRNALAILNTKYVIQKKNNDAVVVQNPDALGNAWFVKSITSVKDANEEIDFIETDDLKETALVHQEFNSYLDGFTSGSVGHVILTDYAPNKLDFEYNVSGEGFIVFSDIWYGPNKGWQAYLDGKPVEHIRVDYILRGMKVPAGEHKITFEFKPKAYYLGENISMMSSLFMILLLLGYGGFFFYKKNKKG